MHDPDNPLRILTRAYHPADVDTGKGWARHPHGSGSNDEVNVYD